MKSALSSHRDCKRQLERQGVRLSKPEQHVRFAEGAAFRSVLDALAGRLNLSLASDEPTVEKRFRLIYSGCIYERALFGRSVWCRLLSNRELRLVEYLNDLNIYFAGAYGRRINQRITCDLLGELLHEIRQSAADGSRRRTVLNFTHAGKKRFRFQVDLAFAN